MNARRSRPRSHAAASARSASPRPATAAVGVAAAVPGTRHVRSPLVRRYSPGGGAARRAGGLAVRVVEPARPRPDRHTVVLLHGLVGSERYFGAAFDAVTAHGTRLVVPDESGFGRSRSPLLEEPTERFEVPAQLAALDAMAAALDLDDAPLTVAGHSLGATLALAWAAHRGTQVQRVVAFNAPLYRSRAEARPRLRRLGVLPAVMSGGGHVARVACWWMCRQRRVAAVVAVALSPHLPLRVAVDGVQHTWPAYRAALGDLTSGEHWPSALAALDARGVPVDLVDGTRDPAPVPGRARRLAARHAHVSVRTVPGAAHHLPLQHSDLCASLLRGRSAR